MCSHNEINAGDRHKQLHSCAEGRFKYDIHADMKWMTSSLNVGDNDGQIRFIGKDEIKCSAWLQRPFSVHLGIGLCCQL